MMNQHFFLIYYIFFIGKFWISYTKGKKKGKWQTAGYDSESEVNVSQIWQYGKFCTSKEEVMKIRIFVFPTNQVIHQSKEASANCLDLDLNDQKTGTSFGDTFIFEKINENRK